MYKGAFNNYEDKKRVSVCGGRGGGSRKSIVGHVTKGKYSMQNVHFFPLDRGWWGSKLGEIWFTYLLNAP